VAAQRPTARRRATLALAFVVAGFGLALLVRGCGDVGGEPNAKVPLRALAHRRGIAVGTAVDQFALDKSDGYRTELAREFSSVTPENVMKWEVTEPEQGKFDFRQADKLVDFARAHGMRVRGHTLVWHIQNPDWLREGRFSRAQMVAIMREHIQTEVARYRGQVASWDVVNEAMGDDGQLRPSLWLQRIGPEYIALAFKFAHEADPAATLFYNEIGIEDGGGKSDAVYRMLAKLRERGLPVGGIGFESHFSLEGPPPSFRKTMKRFAALGLQVNVTEADVRVRLPATQARLDVQAEGFSDAMRDCLAVSACKSFTVWGFTDRYSWIPESAPGFGAATLLDEKLDPKPAYRAVHAALAR
jgi:endo-1,4-beta-xylanase